MSPRTGIERRTLLKGAGTLPLAAGVSALSSGVWTADAAEVPAGFPEPNRRIQLYAVQLPDDNGQVRLGYGLDPDSASYPGPTIEMLEGECIEITLHNDVPAATLERLRTDDESPIGVSLHVHGVRYTHESDGTVHSGSWVAPGESRSYLWYARPRAPKRGIPGTAGYWWYHDHVVGTPHGTGGTKSGLFGALVVRRPSDPVPDHTFVTAFGDLMTINLRRYPATDTYDHMNPKKSLTSFVAKQGERVEFVCIAMGTDMHTWHLHGHTWADTRTGLLGDVPWADDIRSLDNKTIGPGDSFGFQVIAGELSGPGDWMLHCHMQHHSDMGMWTHFHVLDRQGLPWHHDH
jgi:FtsP/CotA-like multicopper oxidase with cupredoxin domain